MSPMKKIIGWLGLAALVSCGSSAPTRQEARDQATTITCQRFSACMAIGPGKAYPTLEACELQWQADWDKDWTAADCEGKIDNAEFSTCLNAIRGTSCDNILDFFATRAKCGKVNVCRSSADGGGG